MTKNEERDPLKKASANDCIEHVRVTEIKSDFQDRIDKALAPIVAIATTREERKILAESLRREAARLLGRKTRSSGAGGSGIQIIEYDSVLDDDSGASR